MGILSVREGFGTAFRQLAGVLSGILRRDPRVGISIDRKSTRLNSSHSQISYAVFCLKKKNTHQYQTDHVVGCPGQTHSPASRQAKWALSHTHFTCLRSLDLGQERHAHSFSATVAEYR